MKAEKFKANAVVVAMLAILFVGLLQDPLRKSIVPFGAVHLAVNGIALVCLAALTIGFQNEVAKSIRAFRLPLEPNQRAFALSFALFCVAILTAVASAMRYRGLSVDSLLWMGVGLVTPGSFLIGIVLAYFVTWVPPNLARRLLSVAVVAIAALGIGHLCEHFQTDYSSSLLLGPLPPKRPWIRTIDAGGFRMLSGFFRSPDIAGWFFAVDAYLALALSLTSRKVLPRWVWLGISSIAFFCCLLSGRRKMQLLLVVGATVFLAGLTWFKEWNRAFQWGFGLAFVVCLAGASCILFTAKEDHSSYAHSGAENAAPRLVQEAIVPLFHNAKELPLFGRGIGTLAPGGQHLGHGSILYSEGGLVRVLVESGIIGLILFLLAVLCYSWGCIRTLPHLSSSSRLSLGLGVSLLAGMLATFLVGQQAYGDPCIALAAGVVGGYVSFFPLMNFQ